MNKEMKSCPICGGPASISSEASMIGCAGYDGDSIVGCDACSVWAGTYSAWDALPRRPVYVGDAPKTPGLYFVVHPLGGRAIENFDEDRVKLYADGLTSKTKFAGPILEPFEEVK